MLIFDEAHHTDEEYPYNIIMDYYHDLKMIKISKTLPQIIGLTASLGVGKSKNIEDAVNHLIKKCANLDAHFISKVEKNENRRELLEFTSSARDHIELCGRNFKNSDFYKQLTIMMNHFEKLIMEIPESKNDNIDKTLNKDKFTIDCYKSYGNWLFNLEKNICNLSKDALSLNSHQIVMISIQHLKKIYKAIEFLRLFNSTTALNFLIEENKNMTQDDQFQQTITYLQEVEKFPFVSDILQKLFV